MLRSQRILVILGLVLGAWLVHVNMCDWVINRNMVYWSAGRKSYKDTIIAGWESSPVQNTNPAMTSGMNPGIVAYDVRFTGVLRQQDVGR